MYQLFNTIFVTNLLQQNFLLGIGPPAGQITLNIVQGNETSVMAVDQKYGVWNLNLQTVLG